MALYIPFRRTSEKFQDITALVRNLRRLAWVLHLLVPSHCRVSAQVQRGVLLGSKICAETTSINGTALSTRYWANDCLVDVVASPNRIAVRDLNLVIMAPGSGAIGDLLTAAEPLIQLAAQHVEDSGFLPGYRLNAYIADSRCSGPDATANIQRAMMTGPVKHGVIGDACSQACVAINDAVQIFNVLQVAHNCISVALSDHDRHPFFTRLVPNYHTLVITTREVLMTFGWQRIGVFHGHRDINTLGRDLFLGYVQDDITHGVHDWTVLMVSLVEFETVTSVMGDAKQRDARIIFNAVYEDMGIQLMCAAYKLGMLPPFWIQIAPSGWWNDNFLLVWQSSTDCTLDELLQGGFGWLAVDKGGYQNMSASHSLAGRSVQAVRDEYASECVKFFGRSDLGCEFRFTPYFYDAVWHFALLFQQYLVDEGNAYESLNTPESQARLFQLSLEADYVGLTGRIRQYNGVDPSTPYYKGSFGDREGPNSIRQLRDIIAGFAQIGHRMPGAGIAWNMDIIWSPDDSSKATSCENGVCAQSGWVPADGVPGECPPGTIWTRERGCAPCPAGTQADGITCTPCRDGFAKGSTESTNCTPCAPGSFTKLLGSTSCEECGTGRFSSVFGSSECTPCEVGSFEENTGSSMCTHCGGILVTELRGATAQGECVCPQHTYHPIDASTRLECVACPEGVSCGVGTDLSTPEHYPHIQEGYYAEMDLSVFKCHDDEQRCRGGPPGAVCAEGRHRLACSECQPGKSPKRDGTCQECTEGTDALPLTIIMLCILSILVLGYWIFDSKDYTKQSHTTLLAAMAVSMLLTLLQQMSAIATVPIDWPNPLSAIFVTLNIFALDLELVKVDCVVQSGSLMRFSLKMLMLLAAIVVVIATHVLFVVMKYSCQFRARKPTLISSVGAVFLVFYVSIFISVLGPFQCVKNPNALWTTKPYPSIICWNGEEHTSMLIVGSVAMLIPVGFLANSSYVIAILPAAMARGDIRFLASYAFLFFRYKPADYWYSLVHLGRSLLIAIATVMPTAAVQLLLMELVFMLQLVLVCIRWPWRVRIANVLEISLTMSMLIILSCAALVAPSEESSGLAWFCAWILLLAACAAIVVGVYAWVHAMRDKKRKTYKFFICHHKISAGCFARLLNVAFAERGYKAFIDTDDLRDLDMLFDYVGTQTERLLVLCTKLIFMRPWCLGEVVTAYRHKVAVTKIVCPDFQEPDEEFIDVDYPQTAGDMSCLTECGIDMALIQSTLKWTLLLPKIRMPGKSTLATITDLCTRLVRMQHTDLDTKPDLASEMAKSVIIVDHGNTEAVFTAYLLILLLKGRIHEVKLEGIPVLQPGELVSPSTLCFMLICSRGALLQPEVLQLLALLYLDSNAVSAIGIPVVADENFDFPEAEYGQKHLDILDKICDNPQLLAAAILGLFKTIATLFQPSHYGSTIQILDAKADDIAARITHSWHAHQNSQTHFDSNRLTPPWSPPLSPRTSKQTQSSREETPRKSLLTQHTSSQEGKKSQVTEDLSFFSEYQDAGETISRI